MRHLIAVAVLAAAQTAGAIEPPQGAQLLNLGCVEALAAIGQADLAGVFSFIAEKDAPAAFADLLVHNKKALKKFLAKVEKDLKSASGVAVWDHEALQLAVSIYGSPLAETLEKPSASSSAAWRSSPPPRP